MLYIVMNADIIHSRKQHFMKEDFLKQITEINDTFKEFIEVEFNMIKGDEIQGLLKKESNVFPIIRMMKQLFHPFELRIGIGVGSIYSEQLIKEVSNSFELNGEAFFYARDAVDHMKETKQKKGIVHHVYFKTDHEALDEKLNLIYSFIDEILAKWKQEIYEIVALEEDGYKYEEIVQKLLKLNDRQKIKKARVNITKKIQRSSWYKIKQMEKLLYKIMKEGIS